MSAWPLSGLQVVDLSSGLAGAYCAKLLADGGADVVKVEDPGGDPLRRVVECGAPLAAGEDGALFRFLCASSESVVGDAALARELVARADVVVWSAGSSVAGDPSGAPRAQHDAHPDQVVVVDPEQRARRRGGVHVAVLVVRHDDGDVLLVDQAGSEH
jgi:hypothetical protein